LEDADTLVDVRELNAQANDGEKWHPEGTESDFDSDLDYARRCARTLKYCRAWKVDYYVKNGAVVEIPARTTVAFKRTQHEQSAMSEYLAAMRRARDDERNRGG
jgi:hypothetical protein